MKIDTRQIPDQGLVLSEELNPADLDLNTDIIKFLSPVKAKAIIHKSYDAVNVILTLGSLINIAVSYTHLTLPTKRIV